MQGALSGYLLASVDDQPIDRGALTPAASGARRNAPFLKFEGNYEQSRFWEVYSFHSDKHFEDQTSAPSLPPFRYPVWCARSGSKILILTEKKRATDYLIEAVLNRTIYPNLKQVAFRITGIVHACKDVGSSYRVTSLTGRVASPDQSLRTMVLYGREITDSEIFRDKIDLFNIKRCGLAIREDDPFGVNDGEIATLGVDGSVSILSFSIQRAIALNRLVNYVITNKLVDNWVSPVAEAPEDRE